MIYAHLRENKGVNQLRVDGWVTGRADPGYQGKVEIGRNPAQALQVLRSMHEHMDEVVSISGNFQLKAGLDGRTLMYSGDYKFGGSQVSVFVRWLPNEGDMADICFNSPSFAEFERLAGLLLNRNFATDQLEEAPMLASPMTRKSPSDRRATRREIERVLRTMPKHRQLQLA